MKNMPYLLVNGSRVEFDEVLEAIFNMTGREVDSSDIQFCQDTPAGTICANAELSSDEYPCIELELRTSHGCILLARAEGPCVDNTAPAVYLYGRGDSYIAQMPVDTRSDDDVEREQDAGDLKQRLNVAGDPDCIVDVHLDNVYHELS